MAAAISQRLKRKAIHNNISELGSCDFSRLSLRMKNSKQEWQVNIVSASSLHSEQSRMYMTEMPFWPTFLFSLVTLQTFILLYSVSNHTNREFIFISSRKLYLIYFTIYKKFYNHLTKDHLTFFGPDLEVWTVINCWEQLWNYF